MFAFLLANFNIPRPYSAKREFLNKINELRQKQKEKAEAERKELLSKLSVNKKISGMRHWKQFERKKKNVKKKWIKNLKVSENKKVWYAKGSLLDCDIT